MASPNLNKMTDKDNKKIVGKTLKQEKYANFCQNIQTVFDSRSH
jgi:hypothetical protein